MSAETHQGEKERAKPINPQIASDFLSLLNDTRTPLIKREPAFTFNPDMEERIIGVLDLAAAEVPGISRDSLEKIIRQGSMRRTASGYEVEIDFPVLAQNWNNSQLRDQRRIAEEEYGVGEKELEFLRAAFAQKPPRHYYFGTEERSRTLLRLAGELARVHEG